MYYKNRPIDKDDDDDDCDNVSETALSFTAGTSTASASSDGITGTAEVQSTSAGTGTTTTTTPEFITGSMPSHLSSIVSDSFTGLQYHDRITASSKIMCHALIAAGDLLAKTAKFPSSLADE